MVVNFDHLVRDAKWSNAFPVVDRERLREAATTVNVWIETHGPGAEACRYCAQSVDQFYGLVSDLVHALAGCGDDHHE